MQLVVNFLLFVSNLFLLLPWWGAVAVLIGLGASVAAAGWWIQREFHRIIHDSVLEMGASLANAEVTVHSARPTAPPTTASSLSPSPDDEEYDPELDGAPTEAADWYWLEVSIAPRDAQAAWDPSSLVLVPADFEPEDPTDICENLGCVHEIEVARAGRYEKFRGGDLVGEQRVRLLVGVPPGTNPRMKFAACVTYFGEVDLPAPAALSYR